MELEVKRRSTKSFEDRLHRLDKTLKNKENIKLVKEFMRDCKLGKTVKNRGKKTIGNERLSGYLSFLKLLDRFFDKPFKKVTLSDIESFIEALQKGEIKSRWDKPYSEESKGDIKKTLKKFFKWLYLDNPKKFDELVGWVESYIQRREIPALSKEEIDKLVENAPNLRLKVFFQTLFDSGCRITEYLNLRWSDFTFVDKLRCYKIRVRGETSKTKGRTISLALSTKLIKEWEMDNPKRKADDFFMPLTHRNAHALTQRWTEKILAKGVGCHAIRHASATYYAGKLMPYVFTGRFGWTIGSTMAGRYIDRAGLEEEEATEKMQQDMIKDYEERIKRIQDDISIERSQMEERIKKQEQQMAEIKRLIMQQEVAKVSAKKR